MGLQHFELTEEKVRKLKPIFESILSRKYGRNIRFIELTWGGITISSGNGVKENESNTA